MDNERLQQIKELLEGATAETRMALTPMLLKDFVRELLAEVERLKIELAQTNDRFGEISYLYEREQLQKQNTIKE